MKNFLGGTAFLLAVVGVSAQPGYWQQAVDYKMDIQFHAVTHQFKGTQKLVYTNNSPDTLTSAYWHLYFNAFQPGSAMDIHNRGIADPDTRLSRIATMKPEEIGYQRIQSLKQDGIDLQHHVEGTVLEVKLNKPLLPGKSTTFDMVFDAQVPAQTRRSGRNNAEGVDYSMSQWFPKLAEYDEMGWHAHPYIAREFYAPWGNYEVNITIDKKFVVAASGILQNGDEIGYGYETEGAKLPKTKEKTHTWRFKAERVHDFMWAADTEYTHVKRVTPEGLMLRFFYIKSKDTENWDYLPEMMEKAFSFIQTNFGKYPYPQFSVIQGGDGGMEYPMSTLVTGKRSLRSLVGVSVHEALHSWYQGLLATNESYLAWMDEGFTTYATAETMAVLFTDGENTRSQAANYAGFIRRAKTGTEEPLSIHADHYMTNSSHTWGAYVKGAVILGQLQYVIGEDAFKRGLLNYFNQWKFKHPDLNDFVRVFEKTSGLELHWYFEYMVNTSHFIDYAVGSVTETNGKTTIELQKIGVMPMPVDVTITYDNGTTVNYFAALDLMRGNKPSKAATDIVGKDWPWTNPNYSIELESGAAKVVRVEIDPSGWMADVNRDNNIWKQ